MAVIKTFKKLDEITGGLPTKTFIGVMGQAGEGKSILLTEFGIIAGKQMNSNVLVVNTEEPDGITTNLWVPVLSKKYDFKGQVFSEYVPNVTELLKLHGIQGSLSIGEKNEFALESVDFNKNKFLEYIKDKNVKVVIYDSLTAPFTPLIAGGRQNLNLRHVAQELFFDALRTLTVKDDIFIMSANHVSYNPTQPFQSIESMLLKGGKSLLHSHKVVFYLEQSKSKYTANVRRLYIVRHPRLPDWKYHDTLYLDDNGYKEITDEEAEQMLKDALKEKKERENKKQNK